VRHGVQAKRGDNEAFVERGAYQGRADFGRGAKIRQPTFTAVGLAGAADRASDKNSVLEFHGASRCRAA
jgi:hypothetical protein